MIVVRGASSVQGISEKCDLRKCLVKPIILRASMQKAVWDAEVGEKRKFLSVENFLWGFVVESGKSAYFYNDLIAKLSNVSFFRRI